MGAIPSRAAHVTTAGQTITVTATNEHTPLWRIIVGTGAASAVVTVKDGNGATISVIDASAKGYYDFGGARLQGGFTAALTGGNADVCAVYS